MAEYVTPRITKPIAIIVARNYNKRPGVTARVVDVGNNRYRVSVIKKPVLKPSSSTTSKPKSSGSSSSKPSTTVKTPEPENKLPDYAYYRNNQYTKTYPTDVVYSYKKEGNAYDVVRLKDTKNNSVNYTLYKNKKPVQGMAVGSDPQSWIDYIHKNYGTSEEQTQAGISIQQRTEKSISEAPIVPTYKSKISDKENKFKQLQNFFGKSNIITTPYDSRTKIGGTSLPENLKWTTIGAIKESNKKQKTLGGKTENDFRDIQNKYLSKTSFGSSVEDMKLRKKHFIGYDEQGERVYVRESPYQIKYNYAPNDPDYMKIRMGLQNDIATVDENIGILSSAINYAENRLPELQSNLYTIKNSDINAQWSYSFDKENMKNNNPELYNWISSNIGFKNVYNKSEAEKLTRHLISLNKDLINKKSLIQQQKENKEELQNSLFSINQYQKLGYEVDINNGEYSFKLPDVEKVHSSIFGDKEATALTSTAFIESPLGMKTFGSAIGEWITGDKKIGQTRRKELAEYSLGLYDTLRKGDYGGYVAKIGTSGAMVQGVYLPAISFGAGYALSGVGAGASGTVAISGQASSGLARFGASRAGSLLSSGSKTGLALIGGYGLLSTGQHLYTLSKERPEALPGTLAETFFTFGLATGGFLAGKNAFHYKYPVVNSPRPGLFSRMNQTWKQKVVGNNNRLSNFYEKIGSFKEKSNIAKTYKPHSFSGALSDVKRTLFKKSYTKSIRDYPEPLSKDLMATGKKAQYPEYKEHPDYAQPSLESWQDKQAWSKYLKGHQKAKITGVKFENAQADILKQGLLSFEANVKGITETGGEIPAGKIRGYSKDLGTSNADDTSYSFYRALFSKSKGQDRFRTKIFGGRGSDKSSWVHITERLPGKEVFSDRQLFQGMIQSRKIGSFSVMNKSGDVSLGEKYLLSEELGLHGGGMYSTSFKNANVSKGFSIYRTIGSGTSYQSGGIIYSNYKPEYGWFKTHTPYKGYGEIADISGGKEFGGNFIKGTGSNKSNLNDLYQQQTQNVFEVIKPQLTKTVKESFKGDKYSSGSGGNISQYEWYQPPINTGFYTPLQNLSFTKLGGFGSTYGFDNLSLLNFLEEGTQVSSNKWDYVKPKIKKPMSSPILKTDQTINQQKKGIDFNFKLIKPEIIDKRIKIETTGLTSESNIEKSLETGLFNDADRIVISKNKFDIGLLSEQKMAQRQQQKQTPKLITIQKTSLAEPQKLVTMPIYSFNVTPRPFLNIQDETIDLVTTETFEPIEPISPPPPFLGGRPEDLPRKKIKKQKKKIKPKIMEKGEADKGLLSDLLSVTRSQARFNKATHPKLSKKTWKEAEKTLYMHVPTVEMKNKKRKKKPKLLRRTKNEFF